MSVAVADIQFAIQDQPQSIGTPPETLRVLGTGDGTTTTFYLPLGKWLQYYAGSATIYVAGTGVSSSTYTISQSGLVTFNAAPASGAIVTASFQATAFAVSDLANVLARNQAQYGGSVNADANVIRGCQIEIINILLANPDRLAAMKEAEWSKDPAAVTAALQKQLAELRTQISSSPLPDRSIPVLTLAGPVVRPYQPGR